MAVRVWGDVGWRRFQACLVLTAALAAGTHGVALATCGDGVRQSDEDCDVGAANGTDGCCSATCRSVDKDGDGLCDARDPCDRDRVPLLPVRPSRLQISRLGNGAEGDERYLASATITVAASPPIDPTTRGLRLVVSEYTYAHRGVLLDAAVPGGPAWNRTTDGTAWSYRDRTGGAGGVTRADVRMLTADPPTVAVFLQGRGAVTDLVQSVFDWPFLSVTLALDAEADTGQCGDSVLTESRCRFRRTGRLTCEPPPPIRSCVGVPDPLACETRNCASAQEHFFAEWLAYLSGDCAALPGFVSPSPDMIFTTAGSPYDFTVSASDETTGHYCIWTSNPAVGHGKLFCTDY
jgi:hypothetical protein